MNSALWAPCAPFEGLHFCCLLLFRHWSHYQSTVHISIVYLTLVQLTVLRGFTSAALTQHYAVPQPHPSLPPPPPPLSVRTTHSVVSLWRLPADTCPVCHFLHFWIFLFVHVLLRGIFGFSLSLCLSLDSSTSTAPGRVTSEAWRDNWITLRRRCHQLQYFRCYVSVLFVWCFA